MMWFTIGLTAGAVVGATLMAILAASRDLSCICAACHEKPAVIYCPDCYECAIENTRTYGSRT